MDDNYLEKLIDSYDRLAIDAGLATRAGNIDRIRLFSKEKLKHFVVALEAGIRSMGGDLPDKPLEPDSSAQIFSLGVSEQLVLTEDQVDNLLEQVKAAFEGLRDVESASAIFSEL